MSCFTQGSSTRDRLKSMSYDAAQHIDACIHRQDELLSHNRENVPDNGALATAKLDYLLF